MAKECPSSMEEGKVTGTISVHETIMSAGCCKTKQPHIYQSNTNNYDDFDNREAQTAGEYVTAADEGSGKLEHLGAFDCEYDTDDESEDNTNDESEDEREDEREDESEDESESDIKVDTKVDTKDDTKDDESDNDIDTQAAISPISVCICRNCCCIVCKCLWTRPKQRRQSSATISHTEHRHTTPELEALRPAEPFWQLETIEQSSCNQRQSRRRPTRLNNPPKTGHMVGGSDTPFRSEMRLSSSASRTMGAPSEAQSNRNDTTVTAGTVPSVDSQSDTALRHPEESHVRDWLRTQPDPDTQHLDPPVYIHAPVFVPEFSDNSSEEYSGNTTLSEDWVAEREQNRMAQQDNQDCGQ
ncbi:26S proteasome complex subunit [Fusarium poae]